ncbi:hypothetical protein GCM10014715_13680 [Streptomyces spiralis]|uniref:Uncharacterized protein n=1 Tax=Streptomyces spiralis TaxID=66376 RepID=A0A919DP33_9ACTN|nr:hypothetical protein GCM10014715_13680 [Streptomyces spiralis]
MPSPRFASVDLAPCASDAVYDYASRPAAVHRAVARVGPTGSIGRPLNTLHGDLGALLPRAADSDVDADGRRERTGPAAPLLHDPRRRARRRTVRHLSGPAAAPPALLPVGVRRTGGVVEHGTTPPADRTMGRLAGGDVANSCALDGDTPGR